MNKFQIKKLKNVSIFAILSALLILGTNPASAHVSGYDDVHVKQGITSFYYAEAWAQDLSHDSTYYGQYYDNIVYSSEGTTAPDQWTSGWIRLPDQYRITHIWTDKVSLMNDPIGNNFINFMVFSTWLPGTFEITFVAESIWPDIGDGYYYIFIDLKTGTPDYEINDNKYLRLYCT